MAKPKEATKNKKLEKTTALQAAKCSKSIYKALSRCDPLSPPPFATHAPLNSEPRPIWTPSQHVRLFIFAAGVRFSNF